MPIIRGLQQLTLAYVTRVRVQDSGPQTACEIRYRKWDGTCGVRVFLSGLWFALHSYS